VLGALLNSLDKSGDRVREGKTTSNKQLLEDLAVGGLYGGAGGAITAKAQEAFDNATLEPAGKLRRGRRR
jgi:hypothetical protein